MSFLQQIYHRHVPEQVRFPIGRIRRTLMDQSIRWFGNHGPLPPRRVLQKVQMTPWAMEYLEVGKRGADTIRRVLEESGIPADKPARVLDFGCGLGRTLRHFKQTEWQLWGSDVDGDSVAWTRRALPYAQLETNNPKPPLPFADHSFDAVYAISVFSHFPGEYQDLWARELARVLRPGGVAIITTMGPWSFNPLPESEPSGIDGFWFFPAGSAFNDSAAIHTQAGLQHFFASYFELGPWTRGGLDGFQDLAVFSNKSHPSAASEVGD